MIRARLARLDPDAHEFVRAAAVLGGDVDFDHARGVAGQDEDRALGALERLLATHLLREITGDSGEALYSFGHDKTRQVVYDDLSGARRRVQHRRALDVLGQPSARTPLERLAYHAVRAQAWDQAVRWCELAADAAVAVFAYSSAATLYEQALDGLARLTAAPEHQAHGVKLRLRLAQVAFYVAPGRLGEWLGPAERDALAIGDATLLAHVRLAQAGALYIQGRFAEALLRAAVGLALVPHGLRNTFGFFPNTGIRAHNLTQLAAQLDGDGYRPGKFWAPLISLVQLVGGPLLAVGLVTRPAAVGTFIFLVIAHVARWRVGRYFWNQLGLEYTLMWTIAVFYFLVHGGGLYSLDHLWFGRAF